jgi:hypothetical protein
MKYIPKSVQRHGHKQLLKLSKHSPTIMVVSGVVGLGVTAVMAAHATRKLDPILETHQKQRFDLELESADVQGRVEQKYLVQLYTHTSYELVKLYGPTLVVGSLSATSVLYGHKILKGRHLATMAAYTGLMEQYQAYRARVAETVGPQMERDIHQGAVGKWEEDPEHKGEYKLKSAFSDPEASYLRPFFDEANTNWTRDATANYLWLKAVQNHMNRILQIKGYVFLSDVYKALGMEPPQESIVTGWLFNSDTGDQYIDFGFMGSSDPNAIAFCNGAERSVRLNFNIDGVIWDLI